MFRRKGCWKVVGEKNTVKAVHDDDLEQLLSNLGVLSAVDNGEISCYFCGETITRSNISAVFPIGNEVAFCCDKGACYTSLIERAE